MWWKQNEEKPLNIPTDILLSCLIPSCWMPSGAASFLGIIPKMLEFVNLFNNYCSEFLYSFCQINPPFLFLWSVSCFPFELWCQNFTFFFTCCNECLRGNNDYHLSYVHLSLFSCLFFISFVETCWKCAPPSTLLLPFLQSDFLLLIALVVLAAPLQQFSLLSPLHLEEIMFPDKEEWGCNSLQVDLGTSRFILILIILFGNRDQTGKQGGK